MDAAAEAVVPLKALCSPFNFGPALQSNRSVGALVEEVVKHWPGGSWEDLSSDEQQVHEASLLNLSSDKSYHLLGWSPRWNFEDTIRETVEWYRAASKASFDAHSFTASQINKYTAT